MVNNYPNIIIIVSAVSAEHYKSLYACGARHIILRTHHGSLKVGETVLTALGENRSNATQIVKNFDQSTIENMRIVVIVK